MKREGEHKTERDRERQRDRESCYTNKKSSWSPLWVWPALDPLTGMGNSLNECQKNRQIEQYLFFKKPNKHNQKKSHSHIHPPCNSKKDEKTICHRKVLTPNSKETKLKSQYSVFWPLTLKRLN